MEHLLAADRAGDSWVVTRLVTAARTRAAPEPRSWPRSTCGVRLKSRPRRSERAALLLELGVAEDNAGQIGALGHMRVAVESAADEHARLAAAVVLGHALARDNRFEEAVEVLDRALAAGSPAQAELTLAAEALAASISTFSVATAPANVLRISAARRRADGVAPTPEQLALAAQLAVRANEPAETGAELAKRPLSTAHGKRPQLTDLPWYHQCAITLLWTERYEELSRLLDEALASARSRGDAGLFSGALAYRGWLALRRGEPRVAEADTRTAIEAEHLPAPRMYRLRSAAVLVEALVEQGRLEAAAAVIEPLDGELLAATTIAAPLRLARGRLRFAQRAGRASTRRLPRRRRRRKPHRLDLPGLPAVALGGGTCAAGTR